MSDDLNQQNNLPETGSPPEEPTPPSEEIGGQPSDASYSSSEPPEPVGEIPPPPPPPPPPPTGGIPVPPTASGMPPVSFGGFEKFKPSESGGRSYTWQEVWTMAVSQPNEDTYNELLRDPNASMQRGLTWIFAITTIAFFGVLVLTLGLGSGANASAGLCGVLCAPVYGAVVVVVFIIIYGLQHLVARILGGQGDFDHMIYAVSAYAAPLGIISGVLSVVAIAIPCVQFVSIILGLYAIALNAIAIKAVHQFDWVRAIVSALSLWVFAICGVACLIMTVLGSLGSDIEDIFDEIQSTLSAPSGFLLIGLLLANRCRWPGRRL